MKHSWISFLLFGFLLTLLILSAALQYIWVGQISDAERERLQSKLQTDTQNFAADFNKEIRGAYFIFQIDPGKWLEKDWNEFNDRFRLWQTQTAYPQLIQDFYFVGKDAFPVRYDFETHNFNPADWTEELQQVRQNIADEKAHGTDPIVINTFTLLMPNYASGIQSAIDKDNNSVIKLNLSGYLVIKLDENVVRLLLEDSQRRFFNDNEPTRYNLSISNKSDSKIIYRNNQNQAATSDVSDASVSLFDLSMNNFRMIVNSRITPTEKKVRHRQPNVITGNEPLLPLMTKKDSVKIQMTDSQQIKPEIAGTNGLWRLNACHIDGSLRLYADKTRRKNLAMSFGLIGILTVGIILIIVSSQRAKIYAKRQIDFVSSVSHEFRTPLAVIYSAGENLADGVTKEENQVSRYGELIKGEGKKLKVMVEQILDFAGANSGRKKYDLREQNVTEIIENALAECLPLIDEKDFAVEKDLAEHLPNIKADANALSQAIQNLIFNALKYSNGAKWLKISANNGGGKVKFIVEDHGIGIAPRDLKHIFEPFYRAKSVVDEQIHGNGLGLSLVKETIEAHGGNITVDSKIGKGSRFIVHLPFINKTPSDK